MDSPGSFLADPPLAAEVAAEYEADVTADGYVNNLTRVWCWRPDVLAAFQALRQDLLAGAGLSGREAAVMVVATAAGSPPETAAALMHAWCARHPGTASAELRALADRTDDPEHRRLALAYA